MEIKLTCAFSIFSLSSYHVLTSSPTINLCPCYMRPVSRVLSYRVTLYCRYPRAACEPAARVSWHFPGSWQEAQVSSLWILHHPPRERMVLPPASSETPLFCRDTGEERNQSQTASSVRLCKADGLPCLLPFGGWLTATAGRSSPCPFPLMAPWRVSALQACPSTCRCVL